MTENVVLHAATRQRLDRFMEHPVHAVMLSGPPGAGKRALAEHLAENMLQLPPGGFEKHSYALLIAPQDGKAIGIDAIRELEHFLSLKVPGKPAAYDRVIVVENAHTLTLEAQNALLKTLEEPPHGTMLILTATSPKALLPTITSRAQNIAVNTPLQPDLEAHFLRAGLDSQQISRAYAVSGGLPGLMNALLHEADHPLAVATEYARRLLGQPVYERLLLVDELSKQRQLAIDVAFIMQQMAGISLRTATGPAARKWQAVLTAAYEAAEELTANTQPKLVLTTMMLSL